ncbi:MAG TPA: glycosyltransferase [Candidatus Bacteroides avicola]|uniref:Glycosyltransferase n=1 Tax=Candidatus Bacteroides avicola TaxID=2838468 RepID=A0A9D2HXY8_9BACE|nr:glycosyltransferase family 2 protein [Bacteroidales bacterium SW292]HJA85927.1 glycosyltransferase [Candidatus Bacteroides avicola]
MTFKVSLIIPIYNVASYIADCLRSVYTQTYPLLEVILVNDATTDDSMTQAAPWIKKLQERYRVKVVNHTWNRGLSASRNTGMEAATTDWIYFIDSDDEITPNCIELLAAQVEKYPDVDFVMGDIKYVGTDWHFPLTCDAYVKGNENILRDYTTYKWYPMAWNRLYRKSFLLQNNLFFKEGLLHEDELYSFQIATTSRAMATVYEKTYIYKVRSSGSITAQRKLKNFEDILSILQEKYAYILKQYQSGIYTIPRGYGMECLYGFALSLASNKLVRRVDKIRLLSAAKTLYRPLAVYSNARQGLKLTLLKGLFSLPLGFVILMLKWRLAMSKS